MKKADAEKYIIEKLKWFGEVREMGGYVENVIVLDIISQALWGKQGNNKHGRCILNDEEFKTVNKVYRAMLDKGLIVKSKHGKCTKLVKES